MEEPPARVIHHQISETIDPPDLSGQNQHCQVVVLDEGRSAYLLLR